MIQTLVSLNETGSNILLHLSQQSLVCDSPLKNIKTLYLKYIQNSNTICETGWIFLNDIYIVLMAVTQNQFLKHLKHTPKSQTDKVYATLYKQMQIKTYLHKTQFLWLFCRSATETIMNEIKRVISYPACGWPHELGCPIHCRTPSDIWCTGTSSSVN